MKKRKKNWRNCFEAKENKEGKKKSEKMGKANSKTKLKKKKQSWVAPSKRNVFQMFLFLIKWDSHLFPLPHRNDSLYAILDAISISKLVHFNNKQISNRPNKGWRTIVNAVTTFLP